MYWDVRLAGNAALMRLLTDGGGYHRAMELIIAEMGQRNPVRIANIIWAMLDLEDLSLPVLESILGDSGIEIAYGDWEYDMQRRDPEKVPAVASVEDRTIRLARSIFVAGKPQQSAYKLFTLAHEWGHFFLLPGVKDEERFCEVFARELLMPEIRFRLAWFATSRHELGDRLVLMRQFFDTSWTSQKYRLNELDLLTMGDYERAISKRTPRKGTRKGKRKQDAVRPEEAAIEDRKDEGFESEFAAASEEARSAPDASQEEWQIAHRPFVDRVLLPPDDADEIPDQGVF